MSGAQQALGFERIKQHPGPVQVQRKVLVNVPGKHFPGLSSAEQAQFYEGQACEYAERHKFSQHLKAWGGAHTGPGIRFICSSDAIDDPSHSGFWTTLALWNRWRHETYKDCRDKEMQFLDDLPGAAAPTPAADAQAGVKKLPPEVKSHFTFVSEGVHTYGGAGKMAGKSEKCTFWLCVKEGCKKSRAEDPIKQVGSGTGQLFSHLDACQPALAQQLRIRSKNSPTNVDEDGNVYTLFTFEELLPHHARFVQKCFRGFGHFYETRANNGLLEWVQGFDKRAGLPHEQTCQQLLAVCGSPPHSPTPLPPYPSTPPLFVSPLLSCTL